MASMFGGGGAASPSGTGVMGSEEMQGSPVGGGGMDKKKLGKGLMNFGAMGSLSAPGYSGAWQQVPGMLMRAPMDTPAMPSGVMSMADILARGVKKYPRSTP